MADQQDIPAMAALAVVRRAGARHARELSREIANQLAQEGLRKYADELEQQAGELEAQIAALKTATRPE